MGTKYENPEIINRVITAHTEVKRDFDIYYKEMLENYKRVAGYIYSEEDLAKLTRDNRPHFQYNLLLPIILQIAGNFIDNQSRLASKPVTPGDAKMALVMSELMEQTMYTANDLVRESATAFINAAIGRIGWIACDWSYAEDPEGMIYIQSYNPFRLMFDASSGRRNGRSYNFLINTGWYRPEEIRKIYAQDDDDLFDLLTKRTIDLLGTDGKTDKIVSYMERVFSLNKAYGGRDQGSDSTIMAINNSHTRISDFWDPTRGLFAVMEFHEMRHERILTIYDPKQDKKFDITKAVDARDSCRIYDQEKMRMIKERFMVKGIEPIIRREDLSQIYQTSICPAMNVVLYDEPYEVQNGNYKYTQINCFDLGEDVMEWKSYVDALADPVKAYNMGMNTAQTYMSKATLGETWAEEDALEEFEDDFMRNDIGGVKKVKKGALQNAKIKQVTMPILPQGYSEASLSMQNVIKEISGVSPNARGMAENSGESGTLFQKRVLQSDIMQKLIQSNALSQLKLVGRNVIDYLCHYMQPGRVIEITRDETDPYWIEVHQDMIKKTFINPKTGDISDTVEIGGSLLKSKYNITIDRAPFGPAAKQEVFEQSMIMFKTLAELNPKYVDPKLLIEASLLPNKDKWLQHIQSVNQSDDQAVQERIQMENQAVQLDNQKKEVEIEQISLENEDLKNDLMVDDLVKNNITKVLGNVTKMPLPHELAKTTKPKPSSPPKEKKSKE